MTTTASSGPRAPATPAAGISVLDMPAFDAKGFRNALGTFVTGVTIVTTCDQAGNPAGLTANSFNSVSLDPPMVLWSLALESTSLAAFRQAEWWAVHILAAGQEALSNRFAQRESDKFGGVATIAGPGGIPLLDGCAARFVCRAAFEYEGGDHAIFLGAVKAFEQTARTPLIYHNGSYGGVFPSAGLAAPFAAPDSLLPLEQLGLIERRAAQPRLTGAGRTVAEGFVALAEIAGDTLTVHELAAFRHLMRRLD